MKKTLLVVLLALVLVLTLSLAACENPVAKIEYKKDSLSSIYKVGDTVDYSKGIITVTYENGKTADMKLTDKGVQHTSIDTSSAKTVTMTITFGGKSVEVEFKVVPQDAQINATIDTFGPAQSYLNYRTKSTDPTAFKGETDIYRVGSINKFKFVPVAAGYDENDIKHDFADIATVAEYSVSDDNVTFTALTAEQAEVYVTKTGNFYKFTTAANNKYFKIKISLDETYNTASPDLASKSFEINVQVVDAYNVYDMAGLSVYDNLNKKQWASLKNTTLECDDKKLSEYTDVKLIVLHNDISINPDYLPATYFWNENTKILVGDDTTADKEVSFESVRIGNTLNGTGFTMDDLKGSLIDGVGTGTIYRMCRPNAAMTEDYYVNTVQKALYYTNQCNLIGNYMEIKTEEGTSGRKLETVLTNKADANPLSHWAILGSIKTSEGDKLELYVKNVAITGNMGKQETDGAVPAGLMGIISGIDGLQADNLNLKTGFTLVTTISNSTYSKTTINISNSKLNDAYSNMVYLWRTTVNIVNSEIKDAGGPLFIMCDGLRTAGGYSEERKCSITVDKDSILESWATGEESWFVANNVTPFIPTIKNLNQVLANVKTNFLKDGKMNLIAAMIPDQGELMKSPANASDRLWAKGQIVRTDGTTNETYSLENQVYWGTTPGADGIDKGVKATNAILFQRNNAFAVFNGTGLVDPLGQSLAAWGQEANQSDMLCIYMNVASKVGANAPYFGIVLGGVTTITQA